MSHIDRAAQFAPFAALTGYDAAVQETARLTEGQKELDETALAVLNEKLRLLADLIEDKPQVSITYFRPDERKSGGRYETLHARLYRIDEHEKLVILDNGKKIPFDKISALSALVLIEE
jgi:hypothetical protein